jgi:alpha-tubulin suppressor-like RCC1 family protein
MQNGGRFSLRPGTEPAKGKVSGMLKSVAGKVTWVGKARVLLACLSMLLALAIGVEAASAATVQQLAAAWGGNDRGQLGNGISGSATDSTRPVGVGGGLNATNIQALAGGNHHSLALKSDGTVWAWGWNNVGQLGNGTFTTTGCQCVSTPAQVGGLSNVIAIAAGGDHGLALKNDGTVWAWGFNGGGELGNGNPGPNSNTPVQVHGVDNVGFLQGVTAIAAGADHNLALKSDSTVVSWGFNNTGQLGNGTTGGGICGCSSTPVAVSNLSGVKAIAGGGVNSLALKTDGTVRSWGSNDTGQLGNGTTGGISNVPVTVSSLSGVKAIDAGGNYALALKKTRTGTVVRAWGGNLYGQLGNPTSGNSSNVPVAVSGLKGVKAISAGGDFGAADHSLALKTDGTVVAWGSNDEGQLGNGDNTFSNSNVPVKVINLSGVTGIAAGGHHSLAK